MYTYAFTVEQDLLGLPAKPGGYPPNFTFGYQTAESEAQAMHSAVLVTEFGDAASTDSTILANELAAQEATQTGGTLWAWKGLSKVAGTCWCTRWQHSSYQTTSNGTPGKGNPKSAPSPADLLIPSRQRLLMRVWPTATAGRLGAYVYDPVSRTFAMVATSTAAGRRGDRQTDTVLSIPSTVHGAVHVSGAAVLDSVVTLPDGSRTAFVTTTLPGTAVRRPATASPSVGFTVLTARVAKEASSPLQPISEPVARAMAEDALNTEAHSPNSSIRSTAQLVQGLAGIVLGSTDPNLGVCDAWKGAGVCASGRCPSGFDQNDHTEGCTSNPWPRLAVSGLPICDSVQTARGTCWVNRRRA